MYIIPGLSYLRVVGTGDKVEAHEGNLSYLVLFLRPLYFESVRFRPNSFLMSRLLELKTPWELWHPRVSLVAGDEYM